MEIRFYFDNDENKGYRKTWYYTYQVEKMNWLGHLYVDAKVVGEDIKDTEDIKKMVLMSVLEDSALEYVNADHNVEDVERLDVVEFVDFINDYVEEEERERDY